MYAAGKIPGGFFKREGRASERATLTARMIDRPIRPLWPKGFRNEVQVICTVLSADMVTPHDILCINGASAALMLSPLPFFGPVGAVRIGLLDGELVVNPTLRAELGADHARPDRRRHEGRPDDGRGRRRRGAGGRAPRGARARPRRDPQALRRAGGSAQPGGQGEVARQRAPRRAGGGPRARHLGADPARRPPRGRRGRRRAERRAGPGDHDGVGRRRHPAPDPGQDEPVDAAREAARSRPSKARCASSSRTTCGPSPTPSRTRRSSSRRSAICSSTASSRRSSCRSRSARPARTGDAALVKDGVTKSYVKKACRGDLQGHRPQEDRRRQAAARRPRHRGDPADRGRGGHEPARARLGPLHARPDAGALVAHARHREGGPADRRPLARARPPLHAPLQLPALLGRGDGLHARPEAARHRPRGARAARARGDDPAGRGLPVHDPHRLRDARVERLVVDGLRLRLDAVADGRRRADQGAGRRASRWASSRKATTT